MNKSELVDAMADKSGLSKEACNSAVTAFTDVVSEELSNGRKVQLIGFGTFETSERSARTGHNPKTGEEIEIESCVVPKFKAGKGLKDAVNEG